MHLAPKYYGLYGIMLALLALLLDQISKEVILGIIPDAYHPGIEVTSFFNLALVWNYGISFGLFAEHRQPLIFTSISLAILVILLIWLYKNTSLLVTHALGLVIGGAMGNVIDRLRFDAVVDFLDFHIGPYHWPAFNLADSFIFIGVVLLCVSSMFISPNHHTKGSNP